MKLTKKEIYKPEDKKAFIKNALRRAFPKSEVARFVIQDAVHPTEKGIRGGRRYTCRICKQTFGLREVQVDHKQPVIPIKRTLNDLSYDELIKRLFCSASNLQVVCKNCHKEKTKKENELRKKYKNEQLAKLSK